MMKRRRDASSSARRRLQLSTPARPRRLSLLPFLTIVLLASTSPSAAIGAELDYSSPPPTRGDDTPPVPRSEGLRGRRRRRVETETETAAAPAAILPRFSFASRSGEGGGGAVTRLGSIDVSGLGDLGAMDAEASILVQLFSDEPPMMFRRIPRRDDFLPPPGGAAVAAPERGGVRTLHAEDVSDDTGYTMSIVTVPAAARGDDDTSATAQRMYVAGSVVTNDTIYDISTAEGMGDGIALVEARRVKDLPDEAEPILLEDVDYDATINATFWNESAPYHGDGSSRGLERVRGNSMGRNQDSSVLDVLVVYTPNAMCAQRGAKFPCENTPENRGPIEARIMLAVEETNTAFELSGIETQVRLVRMHLADNIDDSDNDSWTSGMTSLLQSMRSSSNGFEYMNALRDSTGADFVSLITERKDFCGLAPLGPSADSAHSIVSRVCSTGYYSFAHEMGHNFGCDHNAEAAANGSPPYARGYRNEEDGIRSILAYQCKTKHCTRVLRFSNNKDYSFNGIKIGDATHDNARQINLNFKSMSRYRPTRVQIPVANTDPAFVDKPSYSPTVAPTAEPTAGPTYEPTAKPTTTPSHAPTGFPTLLHSPPPSNIPSATASSNPSMAPSPSPTEVLSNIPSLSPSGAPSTSPSGPPSLSASPSSTQKPSTQPSFPLSAEPSHLPSLEPSRFPSLIDSEMPTTSALPSLRPSRSLVPSPLASSNPTMASSPSPTDVLSNMPSASPSGTPSLSASPSSTQNPSDQPSFLPSVKPSGLPSLEPSGFPTQSLAPSPLPSLASSSKPSGTPSLSASPSSTQNPSNQPSFLPSAAPSDLPSLEPSGFPTQSLAPSPLPSLPLSPNPSSLPGSTPTSLSQNPTGAPNVSTLAAAAAAGEAEGATPYDGPYQLVKPADGDWGSYGNQFDLRADKNIRILGLSIHTSKTIQVQCEVWTRSGSHISAHNNADGGWTKVQDVSVFGLGRHALTRLPQFVSPISVSAGSTQAFTVVMKLGGIAYSPGTSKTTVSISNDDLAVYVGSYIRRYYGNNVAASWLSSSARIWEGSVFYEVERGNIINQAITRQGNTETAGANKRKRKRKGLLSWVADQASGHLLANKTVAEEEEQAEEIVSDLFPEGTEKLADDFELSSYNEPGECVDDPDFHHDFRGITVDCLWVEVNPEPGCGLKDDSVVAFDSCACACREYGRRQLAS